MGPLKRGKPSEGFTFRLVCVSGGVRAGVSEPDGAWSPAEPTVSARGAGEGPDGVTIGVRRLDVCSVLRLLSSVETGSESGAMATQEGDGNVAGNGGSEGSEDTKPDRLRLITAMLLQPR